MSKPYDASTKYLVDNYLPDWLPLSNRRPEGPIAIIDADLSTVTASADKVVFVRGPDPWLFHMELQASREENLPRRIRWYNGLLEYRHDIPVHSLVVLLRPEADAPNLTGEFFRQFPGEKPYTTFRFQVIRVWQLPVRPLLTGGIGLLPLAPLTDEAAGSLPAIIRQMKDRVQQEISPQAGGTFWTAIDVLLGLRYDRFLVDQLLKGVLGMKESVTYQAIIEEGEAKGRDKALRSVLFRQGQKKFGPPDAETMAALKEIVDITRLEQLCDRLLDVNSWQELLG